MTRLRYTPALAAMGRRYAGVADSVSATSSRRETAAGEPAASGSSPAFLPFDSATGAADRADTRPGSKTPSAVCPVSAEGDAITVTLSGRVMLILRLAEAELGLDAAEIVSRGIVHVASQRMPEIARNAFDDEFAGRPVRSQDSAPLCPAGRGRATGLDPCCAPRHEGGDRQRELTASRVRAPP